MNHLPLWQKVSRHKAILTIAAFGFVDMICSSVTGADGVLINSAINFIFK